MVTKSESSVLLLSLDGFRHDYAELHGTPHLDEFGLGGVRAKAMIPSFPSTTFPNHHSIATGMYAGHHGIVENAFWDSARQAEFRFNEAEKSRDGSWWGGTPLWVLAEQAGLRAAAYFWPGTDAAIQGVRPSYYYPYDPNVRKEQQIQQVLEWLQMPARTRPRLITLYFADVDHQGHAYGPESSELTGAVKAVDDALGVLVEGIAAVGADVNLFVLSDHGMAAVEQVVNLTDYAHFAGVKTSGAETDFKVYSDDAARLKEIEQALRGTGDAFVTYRREELPERLRYSRDRRVGDLAVLATEPVILQGPREPGEPVLPPPKGMHGYDVAHVPEMKAIFCAQGPALRAGVEVDEFENVHVYPLIAKILGLTPPAGIDGRLEVLESLLNG